MSSGTMKTEKPFEDIENHEGVVGTIIVNREGLPVKSSLDDEATQLYAELVTQLADKARGTVRDLDPSNDLTFLRVRTKHHEIMVAPDNEFTLICIQEPNSSSTV